MELGRFGRAALSYFYFPDASHDGQAGLRLLALRLWCIRITNLRSGKEVYIYKLVGVEVSLQPDERTPTLCLSRWEVLDFVLFHLPPCSLIKASC